MQLFSKYGLSISFLLLFEALNAQVVQTFTIQPGENMLSVIPTVERMAFPDFQRGTIVFNNGSKSSALLNYSFLTQELLFVNAGGDTLALANVKEVKMVQAPGGQLFNAGGRMVKKDTAVGNHILAVGYAFSTADRRKVGAFGTTTDGATDSYIALDATNIGITDMTSQVQVVLSRKPYFFIGDSELKFVAAAKKQIAGLFPGKQAEINRYIQEKQVNFSSRQELIALLHFLQHL
ncbi:MAG: hypothetical protein FJX94_05390 [Bacteroidetes bacterium]|nr:hypothetical protein [Bacteroidota bacterium]